VVASAINGFGRVTAEAIDAWLAAHSREQRFFAPLAVPPVEDAFGGRWASDVSGAKLLAALFSELSETRVSYDKTEHGFALTKWLIEHDPESLRELSDLLLRLLPDIPGA